VAGAPSVIQSTGARTFVNGSDWVAALELFVRASLAAFIVCLRRNIEAISQGRHVTDGRAPSVSCSVRW
jgi:hypothetical protein